MTTSFTDLNLHPTLLQTVTELGYTEPTPIQSAIIPTMLTGRDVIGQAQTGTGKTAAFALPMLQNLVSDQRQVQGLVLTPTRELALQVANAIYEYGQHQNVRVLAIYGGQSYNRQIARLKKGVDIVIGTPGRMLDLIRQKVLDLSAARTVVLDEADEMLSMGFIEDIQAILDQTPTRRQTALFSATLPSEIRRLASQYLLDPFSATIQPQQVTVDGVEQRYYLVNAADKTAALTRLFEVEPIRRALIFTRTRVSSGDLANELSARGFAADVLNGDLAQEARERVLNRFRQGQIKVLVATDVAARGLDIDDISHVINYDLPEEVELYVHRIGRTARAGKTGIAISLVTPAEQWRLRRLEGFTKQTIARASLPSEEDILKQREGQLLKQMETWLGRARYQRERELVMRLVEAGHDPLEIASAALKIARAEEKQRPIAPISEVQTARQRRDRRELRTTPGRGSRPDRGEWAQAGRSNPARRDHPSRRESASYETASHEKGMIRLTISQGRVHGIRPNDVVGTIAFHANIPGYTIGKIHIHDHHTLVDVPEQFLAQVLTNNGSYRINKQPVSVEVAS
ncbi:MAG: DEAD/DEAH box helicase [Anaerolineales bacterium]|nr:DEAD/DEAH box helicase [Anaerolineales bacterium]